MSRVSIQSIAEQVQTGPPNYELSREASVTVVIADNSQVYRVHTFRAGNVDVQAIIADAGKILH